jgi:hypothetical protein
MNLPGMTCRIKAVKLNYPCGRGQKPRNHANGGGFSSAIRPKKAYNATSLDLKIDRIYCKKSAELLG